MTTNADDHEADIRAALRAENDGRPYANEDEMVAAIVADIHAAADDDPDNDKDTPT